MKLLEYLGKTIEYTRIGGRQGWIGLIVDINSSKVVIEYNNSKIQSYNICALEGITNHYVSHNVAANYLKIIDPQLAKAISYYIVLDAQGRQVFKGTNSEEAERQAEILAKQSQGPFYLLETIAKFERKQPPVIRTKI